MDKAFAGKRGLVLGVANKRSIAWAIARRLAEGGAELAFTFQGERIESSVRELAETVSSRLVTSCDVRSDEDVVRVFSEVGEAFDGKLDLLVHSVAFADAADLEGRFTDTPRERFWLALDVSAYSLVAFHGGLYTLSSRVPDASWFAWRALVRHGYRPFAHAGAIAVLRPSSGSAANPLQEPLRTLPFFCQGWFAQSDNGLWMVETHSSVWLYGPGRVRLRVRSLLPLSARIAVDGSTVAQSVVRAPVTISTALRGRRWHLLTFDVPRLVHTTKDRVGLRLVSLERVPTSPSSGSPSRRRASSP